MAILSIQSHVVFGYAGNTAAVFPMQRLGHEVWAVNTVEFSNHTGYGTWRGKALDTELVSDLVCGLEDRGVLDRCQAVLSGYLGSAQSSQAVIDAVKKVKKENPAALYCCDPVMGDIGRGFYVKAGIPDIFKKELVPIADIVCPNQFELEALTGLNTQTIDNAVKAINMLHEMGPSIVLVTSFLKEEQEICMLASDKKNIFIITTPKLPLGDGVAGTGDMTSAVFLCRYLETRNLEKTLELCTASVFGVLEESYKAASASNKNMPMELKIIDAQEQLINPANFFKAEKVSA